MADAQMSFSTITGGFLKRNYGSGSKAIENAQNLKAFFYSKISKSSEKPSGDGFYIPINVEGNESGRASNEAEAFANAQSVTDVQFVIKPKTTFWPFQLTGLSMEVATSSQDSFARSLKRQQQDNMERFLSDLNRQCWGSATGEMTKANGAVVAANAVICDSVRNFRTGQYVDIWTAAGGTKQVTNRKITAIAVSTKTITLDGAAFSCDDNAIIVKSGVLDNAPSDYKELFGAEAIVDTTTYNTNIQSISKSTYPVLQATVVAAGGVSISNKLLQQIETGVENASNSLVKDVWSSRTQRDKYLELLTPMKRFMNDDAMDSGARKPVEWNGKPWNVDKDCAEDEIFMFGEKGIEKFVLTEPDIVDKDGAVIRALPGADIYQGYYKSHMNLGSLMPNRNGKLTGLATS